MHLGQGRRFLLTVPVTSESTAATGVARFGNVDRQCPPGEVSPVQSVDCSLGFALVTHLHETETARLAAVAIRDYASRFNLTVLGESLSKVFVPGIETEVSYVYVQAAILLALSYEPGTNELRTDQACAV